jgi:tRNA G18 (ribose-2'-O)-methylase SpoU
MTPSANQPSASNATPIDNLDDPRLAHYRALKDRDVARDGGRFIAEGEMVVRRLLDSAFATESVLLSQRRVAEIAPIIPDRVAVYVLSDSLIEQVIGFQFHSGVMAVGVRGKKLSLDDLPRHANALRLMICPEIANTENLGGLIRIAAAFGMDAMILGPRSCDPFFRQAVRVSMGTVFKLPIVQSKDLLRDLDRLQSEWHVQLIATVLHDEAAESLAEAEPPARFALLFGNEAQGLSEEVIQRCDRRVTIPMRLGTDSLNVMVAAGIFLFHFTGSEI